MPWPRRKLVHLLDSGAIAGGVPPAQGPGGVTAGLGVWYQADQEVTSAGDGQPVSVWGDSGANGFDLGQVTAGSRPTLKTSERNGLPVVRFDGVDDYMVTASILGSLLAGPTAQTVFIVQMQHSADTQSTTYGWDPAGNGANILGAHLKYQDSVLYYDTGPATGLGRLTAAAPEPWKGTWHVVELVRDGSTTSSSITIEGNPVSSYTAQPTAAFNPAQSASLRLGDHGGSLFINDFQGDIAEFIMYNRTLTTIERDTVRNYLKGKWGIAQDKVILDAANSGYVLINSTTNDRLAVS